MLASGRRLFVFCVVVFVCVVLVGRFALRT